MAVGPQDYGHDYAEEDEEELDYEYEQYSGEEGEEIDGDMEEIDEEEQEEIDEDADYIEGLRPAGGSRQAPVPAQEWKGLRELPAATQAAFSKLLGQLREQGKNKLTILLLGKTGVGKSSTTNSFFKETVAQVLAFQPESQPSITRVARTAHGFTLTVYDTPGLLEQDEVSEPILQGIAHEMRNVNLDVVLYVDRLELYRVDQTDMQVLNGITRMFGANVWNNTIIGFTHAHMTPPAYTDYDGFVRERADALRSAMRSAGAPKTAALPVALIENSSRCPTNEAGEKVLPNGVAWLPDLMLKVVSHGVAPFKVDPKAEERANPDKRGRWMIPFAFAAQLFLRAYVLPRVFSNDANQDLKFFDEFGVRMSDEEIKQKNEMRKRREREAEQRRRRVARSRGY